MLRAVSSLLGYALPPPFWNDGRAEAERRYFGKTNPSLVLRFAIATIHRMVASPLVRFRMQR